ncbi:unnamed protein product [Allacma fusca]|uniref:Uncharacterized protein n=1 Tax=Allacma fusca TaxID=39272 RepID=A0A8J2KH70_9HEXA|nr:unnamed protein product [Allacma fusca]
MTIERNKMSSGNQNSYDYGEPYRNYPSRPAEDLNQRRIPDPSIGARGYPFPPGNPYPPMYGQLPTNVHIPPMFNRSGPPPMPPRFGNYPNQVNNWTQYHASPWRLDTPPANIAYSHPPAPVPQQSSSTYLPIPKPPSPERVTAVTDNKRSGSTDPAIDEKDEEKDTKKPVPIMVGKRRGGKVLPTGIVKKPRAGNATQGRTDAWGQYMAEVKKYKEQSCEEERKNRPLVK